MSRPWTAPYIRAALTDAGWTLAAIDRRGDEQGPFYDGAARQSLRGGNYRAAAAISKILGVPMRELFPGMYLTARPGRPDPVRSEHPHTATPSPSSTSPKCGLSADTGVAA
jgi:lambda repressor-like predicted transcriptional regulator